MLGLFSCFFFNDTATTEIYTLSLHDALPISRPRRLVGGQGLRHRDARRCVPEDRKSTRLNSSHLGISYAVFCLKKKKKKNRTLNRPPTQSNDRTTQANLNQGKSSETEPHMVR